MKTNPYKKRSSLTFDQAVLLSFIFLGLNSLIKIILNIYLSHNYEKFDLIRLFSFIDILSIFFLFLSGYKDNIVVYISKYGNKFILYIFKSYFLYSIFLLFLLLPTFYYFNNKLSFITIQYNYFEILFGCIFSCISIYLINFFLAKKDFKINTYYELLKTIIFFLIVVLSFNQIKSLVLLYILSITLVALFLIAYSFYRVNITRLILIKKEYNLRTNFNMNVFYSTFEYIFSLAPIYLTSFLITKLFISFSADFLVVSRPLFFGFMSVFIYPIYRFILPELVNKKNTITYKKIFYYFVSIALFLPFLLYFFTEEFLLLLFDSSYQQSIILLKILLISIPFHFFISIFFGYLKANKKFFLTMIIKFFSFLIFVFMLLVFKNSTVLIILYKYVFYTIFVFIFTLAALLFLKLNNAKHI